jgi:iron complex transport system permease protein
VLSVLFGKKEENLANQLIWDVRIPRVLMAFLSGGCLAVAGQCMQILVRNPMADPYTMGTASGAALGVNFALIGWLPGFLTGFYLIPFWGFAGALASSFLVLALVAGNRKASHGTILLVGVSVSIMANGLISLITYWSSRQNEVRHLLFWAFGNLDKSNWESLALGGIMAVIPLILVVRFRNSWNLLLLGDEKAASIGLKIQRVKNQLLIISALLTASVVCFVGPIGFVGLLAPYWTRKLLPVTQNGFWFVTFLAGALFISSADLIARVAFQPFGLPIGLVTSLIGVPFFLYLLRESAGKTSF